MENIDCSIKDITVVAEEISENTFAEAMQILSCAEKDIILDVKSTKRRLEIAATRLLLKNTFGNDALLLHTEHGAPFIENYSGNISISHSKDKVYIAFSPLHKVGVDIQYWSKSLVRVTSKYLSDREAEAINVSDRQALLKAWTVKEAVYKLLGIKDLSLKSIDTLKDDILTVMHCGTTYQIKIHTITTDDFSLAIAWM